VVAEAQPGRLSDAAGVAVGIVVPTWRDDAALATLLPRLAALEPPPLEVLVVDGAASEVTRALVEGAGARWLASPPGRGTQLNRGARAVRGEVLWFVHADAGVAADSLAAIAGALGAGADGGAFRFRFGGPSSATKRLLERAIAWRCRHGVAYGDQGLFARRAAFERAGGFAEQPLFEEVSLVRALRAGGRFALLDAPILVSPRRWEQDGYWRRTLSNRLLALGHAAGISPRRLAEWYRRSRN
jgi:rSAM/selenodomain-associated transferase 2